jgi:hypothetical protein
VITYEDITQLTNEQIAESCEDAADLLEGHWIQGNWFLSSYDDEDQDTESWGYCLEGALSAALGLDNIDDMEQEDRLDLINCPVYSAVLETLNHQIHQQLIDAGASEADTPREWYGEGDLPNWNDSDGRSEQEVVDLLRKTAKRVLVSDV